MKTQLLAAGLALAALQAQAVSIQLDLDALFGHGEGYVAFDLRWGAAVPTEPLFAWTGIRDEAHSVTTSLRVWDDGDALRLYVQDYMRAGVYSLGPLAFGPTRELCHLDLGSLPERLLFAPLGDDPYGARVYVTGGPDFPQDLVIPPIVEWSVPDTGSTLALLSVVLLACVRLSRRVV